LLVVIFGAAIAVLWLMQMYAGLIFCLAAIFLLGYWALTLGLALQIKEDGLCLRRLLGWRFFFVPFEEIEAVDDCWPRLARYDRRLLLVRLKGRPNFWMCGDVASDWMHLLPGMQVIFPDYPALAAALKENLEPLGKFREVRRPR
jgi:hypothetical protein